jgi:putative membrane protein
MENKISIFLKGFLMGVCDLIPGISGGTIAFITGIYTRLIDAVTNFSPKLFYDIFTYPIHKQRDRLKEDIKKLDLLFLLVLMLGIGSALMVGSRIIKFLLMDYFAYTLSFFIGLILASSKIIFNHIQNHNIKNISFGFLGIALGLMLSMLVPLKVTPTLGYVFLGGFFAVSAMFLPGISGAFILLIMGLYEFMINVLNDISSNLSYFLLFIAGALSGAFCISRIISFLFKKNKCKTLYVLLGLVIGALSTPLKKILQIASFQISNVVIMVFWLLLGALLVVLVTHRRKIYERKRKLQIDVIEKETKND